MEVTISKNKSDKPKLKARSRAEGRMALFLEFYCGYIKVGNSVRVKRRREYLDLYIFEHPKNALQREHNKTMLAEAAKVRTVMEYELLNGRHGYSLGSSPGNFHDYYREYLDKYTKKDIGSMRLAHIRFNEFLSYRYPHLTDVIKAKDFTVEMIYHFLDYVKSRSRGSGANAIFARFKKVMKDATMHDFFIKNPCEGINCTANDGVLVKDILSEKEMVRLISTRWDDENPEIRKAFIFSLYTGVRFCDIKSLTYRNIDFSNSRIVFEQNKTKGRSRNSIVDNPLNRKLLKIVGRPFESEDELLFELPTQASCNNYLKRWTLRAGIKKKITWHCARHSFGTLIQLKTGNINTVRKLLGHSSISHTQKYLRAADELGRKAVSMLPDVEF